jgi:hypothetical protein
MDRRRIIIMVVLLGGLVWAVTSSPLTKRLFGGRTPARPAPAPIVGALGPLTNQPAAAAPTPVPSTPATPLSSEELGQWRGRHATAWSRDPFFTAAEEQALATPKVATAPVTPPAPLPAYTVKAILISGADKVAALNGRLVSEGDAIGEERVVEIRPDAVVLERGGQRRRLAILGGTTPIQDAGASAARGR